MPLFECPNCRRQQLLPLAVCEWLLKDLSAPRLDTDQNPVYTLICPDCMPLTVEGVEGDLLDHG